MIWNHVFGWAVAVLCLVLLLKYAGRIANRQSVNKALRKIHEPMGIVAVLVGLVHGTISLIGQYQGAIEDASGIMLMVLIGLLAMTYYQRRTLKAKWFMWHRRLAMVFVPVVIVHIITVHI